MVARLYDKSLEIAHSGKGWMREIWADRRDPSAPVWRLEFQLRRQVLAESSLREPQDVTAKWQNLWGYAMKWLSLREPAPNATRTRWPVADLWSDLTRSKPGIAYSPLVRKRIREHDESAVIRALPATRAPSRPLPGSAISTWRCSCHAVAWASTWTLQDETFETWFSRSGSGGCDAPAITGMVGRRRRDRQSANPPRLDPP
jgi:hypothetical protein